MAANRILSPLLSNLRHFARLKGSKEITFETVRAFYIQLHCFYTTCEGLHDYNEIQLLKDCSVEYVNCVDHLLEAGIIDERDNIKLLRHMLEILVTLSTIEGIRDAYVKLIVVPLIEKASEPDERFYFSKELLKLVYLMVEKVSSEVKESIVNDSALQLLKQDDSPASIRSVIRFKLGAPCAVLYKKDAVTANYLNLIISNSTDLNELKNEVLPLILADRKEGKSQECDQLVDNSTDEQKVTLGDCSLQTLEEKHTDSDIKPHIVIGYPYDTPSVSDGISITAMKELENENFDKSPSIRLKRTVPRLAVLVATSNVESINDGISLNDKKLTSQSGSSLDLTLNRSEICNSFNISGISSIESVALHKSVSDIASLNKADDNAFNENALSAKIHLGNYKEFYTNSGKDSLASILKTQDLNNYFNCESVAHKERTPENLTCNDRSISSKAGSHDPRYSNDHGASAELTDMAEVNDNHFLEPESESYKSCSDTDYVRDKDVVAECVEKNIEQLAASNEYHFLEPESESYQSCIDTDSVRNKNVVAEYAEANIEELQSATVDGLSHSTSYDNYSQSTVIIALTNESYDASTVIIPPQVEKISLNEMSLDCAMEPKQSSEDKQQSPEAVQSACSTIRIDENKKLGTKKYKDSKIPVRQSIKNKKTDESIHHPADDIIPPAQINSGTNLSDNVTNNMSEIAKLDKLSEIDTSSREKNEMLLSSPKKTRIQTLRIKHAGDEEKENRINKKSLSREKEEKVIRDGILKNAVAKPINEEGLKMDSKMITKSKEKKETPDKGRNRDVDSPMSQISQKKVPSSEKRKYNETDKLDSPMSQISQKKVPSSEKRKYNETDKLVYEEKITPFEEQSKTVSPSKSPRKTEPSKDDLFKSIEITKKIYKQMIENAKYLKVEISIECQNAVKAYLTKQRSSKKSSWRKLHNPNAMFPANCTDDLKAHRETTGNKVANDIEMITAVDIEKDCIPKKRENSVSLCNISSRTHPYTPSKKISWRKLHNPNAVFAPNCASELNQETAEDQIPPSSNMSAAVEIEENHIPSKPIDLSKNPVSLCNISSKTYPYTPSKRISMRKLYDPNTVVFAPNHANDLNPQEEITEDKIPHSSVIEMTTAVAIEDVPMSQNSGSLCKISSKTHPYTPSKKISLRKLHNPNTVFTPYCASDLNPQREITEDKIPHSSKVIEMTTAAEMEESHIPNKPLDMSENSLSLCNISPVIHNSLVAVQQCNTNVNKGKGTTKQIPVIDCTKQMKGQINILQNTVIKPPPIKNITPLSKSLGTNKVASATAPKQHIDEPLRLGTLDNFEEVLENKEFMVFLKSIRKAIVEGTRQNRTRCYTYESIDKTNCPKLNVKEVLNETGDDCEGILRQYGDACKKVQKFLSSHQTKEMVPQFKRTSRAILQANATLCDRLIKVDPNVNKLGQCTVSKEMKKHLHKYVK
ncbi:uncharacterized protein LOC116174339 isoform X2 [Photinus pyralis]|uniref:uncharacterized protein LOC116174339 isoform X2 n=1 Tax=Photinus pyralis TaxID=7054 RepID=UPI001266E626|nr:uncharacterized protein LOC116174339 isoform X2 [Photinus pyralis]